MEKGILNLFVKDDSKSKKYSGTPQQPIDTQESSSNLLGKYKRSKTKISNVSEKKVEPQELQDLSVK